VAWLMVAHGGKCIKTLSIRCSRNCFIIALHGPEVYFIYMEWKFNTWNGIQMLWNTKTTNNSVIKWEIMERSHAFIHTF